MPGRDELLAQVGRELGTGDWLSIGQDTIELEGSDRPALVADTIARAFY